MIQNTLEEDLVLLGVTWSLTALVPGGAGLAAAMAAVGTKSIAASIKKCKNGILSKRGIYVAGLGKPATGNIVNLYMT